MCQNTSTQNGDCRTIVLVFRTLIKTSPGNTCGWRPLQHIRSSAPCRAGKGSINDEYRRLSTTIQVKQNCSSLDLFICNAGVFSTSFQLTSTGTGTCSSLGLGLGSGLGAGSNLNSGSGLGLGLGLGSVRLGLG